MREESCSCSGTEFSCHGFWQVKEEFEFEEERWERGRF